MKTTWTTDKNNFFCGGYARRFKIAARFRGEKEDVVFIYVVLHSISSAKTLAQIENPATQISPRTIHRPPAWS